MINKNKEWISITIILYFVTINDHFVLFIIISFSLTKVLFQIQIIKLN